MKRLALTSMLVLTIAGCALNPANQYGEHLGIKIDHDDLAKSSVAPLIKLYPPARTRLTLQQKADGPFGTAFIKRLRESGYAVEEPVKKAEAGNPMNPDRTGPQVTSLKQDPEPTDPNTLPLHYVLSPSGHGLYHLTILVGNQSLSRPYLLENGRLVAAGAWIRKE